MGRVHGLEKRRAEVPKGISQGLQKRRPKTEDRSAEVPIVWT
jgi:hypothetical protein